MNYRAQGNRLDSDIRDLVSNKLKSEGFKKRWDPCMYTLVKQLFVDKSLEILASDVSVEKKSEEMSVLSNKISMFCVPFI